MYKLYYELYRGKNYDTGSMMMPLNVFLLFFFKNAI